MLLLEMMLLSRLDIADVAVRVAPPVHRALPITSEPCQAAQDAVLSALPAWLTVYGKLCEGPKGFMKPTIGTRLRPLSQLVVSSR